MNWAQLGTLLLGTAVLLGAFGAHGLRARLDAYSLSVWEKAVFYQFIHGFGLLITPILARTNLIAERAVRPVCALFAVGILFFSGSLYVLALSGVSALGAITPLGGLAFLAAWTWLAVAMSKR